MGSIYSNQVIKVHHHICTNINWNNGSRGTSWNNTQKVVPSTNDSSSMTLNEFLQWDGHSLFYCAWVVYMARNIEQLCTSVSCASEPSKPVPTSPTNGRCHCNCFYIVDSGWTAENTNVSRERWLQAGFAGLSLQRFNQRGFLSTDICSSTTMQVDIEVKASATGILAQETSFVCLLDGHLHIGSFIVELSSDINICCSGAH